MTIRRFLSFALAGLLALAPLSAEATPGTPLTLGSKTQAASATNVLTTATNVCPAGNIAQVRAAFVTVADVMTGVADSAGNTWTTLTNVTGTGIGFGFAWSYVQTTIPIGATITATFGGVTNTTIVAACSARAVQNPIDINGPTQNGLAATSATSVNSGVQANGNELVMAFVATATSSGTVTCNGSWTAGLGSTGGTPSQKECLQKPTSTATIAWAPSWVSSNNYVTFIVSLSGYNGAVMMMGAGQ